MLRLSNKSKKSDEMSAAAAMPKSAHSDISTQIEKIVSAIEQSRLDETLLLSRELTRLYPNSANVRIIAASVELAAGDREAAKEHYKQLIAISPKLYDGFYNLALTLHQEGKHDEAARTLRQADGIASDLIAHWNDSGLLYRAAGKQNEAAECFRRVLAIEPNNQTALNSIHDLESGENNLDVLQTLFSFQPEHPLTTISAGEKPLGKKILVVARHQMFVKPLVDSLQSTNEVLLLNGDSPERVVAGLAWADVAWFDWCDDLLAFATQQKRTCPIIARCHSYEVFTEMPSQVNWSNVSRVVFVNHSVKELFQQSVKSTVQVEVIANGLDLDKFPLQSAKPMTKKIASVGYINYKKNPALLLHCFKAIHEYDSSYTLHIAGEHQDPRIALYMSHFLQKHPLPVSFDGWVADMPTWYADKSFVISTSLFESFHFSIAEGMSMGLLPLVHDWYGASNLYPREVLFSDPNDAVRLLRRWENLNVLEARRLARVHVEQHFDEKRMLASMHTVISQTVSQQKNRGMHVAASR